MSLVTGTSGGDFGPEWLVTGHVEKPIVRDSRQVGMGWKEERPCQLES